MKPTKSLRTLASLFGISSDYRDPGGTRQAVSAATLQALLSAMHVPDGSRAAAVLRRLRNEEKQAVLPPVLVTREDVPLRVPVTTEASGARGMHRWTLRLESGETRQGEFRPSELMPFKAETARSDTVTGLLQLPPIAAGYHQLDLEQATPNSPRPMPLILTPARCYQPSAIQGDARVWGPGVQLYGLRSRRNWGIGDFTDLQNLVGMTANAGGGIVALNPLHALSGIGPGGSNPHAPSSRIGLNPLYIDIEALPEFRECAPAQALVTSERFQARLRSLRVEERVNYHAVDEAKSEILELLFRHFRERHMATRSARAIAFEQFRATWGTPLEAHARFEALRGHVREGITSDSDWTTWPDALRSATSPEVTDFAAVHRDAVDFRIWLQWVADEQLGAAGQQSWRRGLGIGICVGLAMAVHPAGAETWHRPDLYADGARVGRPPGGPDHSSLEPLLCPLIPHRLQEAGYLPFIESLRANMRHAGAVRIDQIGALDRLFWQPIRQDPPAGSYVAYPFEDLLGILALESQRSQCLVIGDGAYALGEAARARLDEAGVLLSCSFFNERRDDGSFQPATDYPRDALVSLSGSGQPTLRGFWQGTDLDARSALGLFASDHERDALLVARAQDRARFLLALAREHLLPEGATIHPVSIPELTAPFVSAIHAYLAHTPSRILIVQPEDILGTNEQANLPGSRDQQYPNWRGRLSLDMEDWRADERFSRVGDLLRRELGSSVTPQPAGSNELRHAVIPRATYRLQFNRDFTFAQAAELVPYLAALGISHCYASPYLTARPGSAHGYDIVDHSRLNPDIGSPDDYERFVAALGHHGMGHILDIVPNHMGVMGADNAWWIDVLENGPASAYARFFDIDWDPPNRGLSGKVLLPILGDHYGTVLNRGELRLEYDAEHGELSLFYYHHRLPIDPSTYPRILAHRLDRLGAAMGENSPHFLELQSLLDAFGHLPSRQEADTALQLERQRDKEVQKRHLAVLSAGSVDIKHHIAETLQEFNGSPGDPVSFDLLHELIQAQGYRTAYWRVASDEINYRRFFDINDLAALRMEEPAVFEATHRFVLDLVAQGKIDGLRIDHPDGLYDPGGYFARLHEAILGRPLTPGEPLPIFLVIEKILADHEQLLDDWPIHGATGYRFANLTNALFVDRAAERRITRIYATFIDVDESFDTLLYHTKKLVMDTAMASELNVLANRLARLAATSRETCDFTLNGLREALGEVASYFPVYRSYVGPAGPMATDRRHIAWAVTSAKRRNPAGDPSIFDFLEGVLTTDIAQGRTEAYRAQVLAVAMTFQQFSAPVMAKGLEDTAFYRYHRLVSLNDVGGDPRHFGTSVAAYHAAARARAKRWPHSLLASSTHDSKRSEDVRARINALSELPATWQLMLKRWTSMNRGRKRELDGLPSPSANDEYLLYQTLIGTWPIRESDAEAEGIEAYRGRIQDYMVKAAREAKERTSWINVNEPYEAALKGFIGDLLTPGGEYRFLDDFVPAIQPIIRAGLVNSLAQTLLKLTSPGVPDIYQGCECWQFTLVDPDNRHAIDFALRRQLLDSVEKLATTPHTARTERLRGLLDEPADGRLKLYLIHRTLQLRACWPELFQKGDYRPLSVHGTFASHVCAFARCRTEHTAIVAVPRLTQRLLGEQDKWALGARIWRDTTVELPSKLAGKAWYDALTGATFEPEEGLPVGTLFDVLPMALLAEADSD